MSIVKYLCHNPSIKSFHDKRAILLFGIPRFISNLQKAFTNWKEAGGDVKKQDKLKYKSLISNYPTWIQYLLIYHCIALSVNGAVKS